MKLHVFFLKPYNFLSSFQKVLFSSTEWPKFSKRGRMTQGVMKFVPLLCIKFSQTILVWILWSQPIKHFIPHWWCVPKNPYSTHLLNEHFFCDTLYIGLAVYVIKKSLTEYGPITSLNFSSVWCLYRVGFGQPFHSETSRSHTALDTALPGQADTVSQWGKRRVGPGNRPPVLSL